jgi:endonuclease/exonuclease/phosphatase family metal-dependent hydrolase
MKYIVFLTLLLASMAHAESLKILSWNIYMIPKPILWTSQFDRAEVIGDLLTQEDHDVIFFQEAFSAGARKRIWNKIKSTHPYESGVFKKKKFLTVLNSGLWVVSKYPITVLDHVYFDRSMHSDKFATKGSLMVEVQLPNRKVQIVGTHLQAWFGAPEDSIRYSQLSLIRQMMDEFRSPGVDQVILGDLNFDDYRSEYSEGINRILDTHSIELTGPIRFSAGDLSNSHTKPDNHAELLDYILLRNDSSTGSKIKNKMLRKRTMTKKGKLLDLSDHYGIEAEIEFAESKVPVISEGH